MRGSRARVPRQGPRGGSIPAHAGQPLHGCFSTPLARVDPRACGAAGSRKQRSSDGRGRSPRMRGSHGLSDGRSLWFGSIPAHAGQPGRRARRARAAGVDPRACGAAPTSHAPTVTTLGRSPRMRGSRALRAAPSVRQGSIPAHAGQPRCDRPARGATRVDPRACGAALLEPLGLFHRAGRSPRMRGSRCALRPKVPRPGSIPAHAGQPQALPRAQQARRVDPRACGAALIEGLTPHCSVGRSPRMRGSPVPPRRRAFERGSIPAHAGQPSSTRS